VYYAAINLLVGEKIGLPVLRAGIHMMGYYSIGHKKSDTTKKCPIFQQFFMVV
jgi:hypothetical protein